jgi:hypothetical protein
MSRRVCITDTEAFEQHEFESNGIVGWENDREVIVEYECMNCREKFTEIKPVNGKAKEYL